MTVEIPARFRGYSTMAILALAAKLEPFDKKTFAANCSHDGILSESALDLLRRSGLVEHVVEGRHRKHVYSLSDFGRSVLDPTVAPLDLSTDRPEFATVTSGVAEWPDDPDAVCRLGLPDLDDAIAELSDDQRSVVRQFYSELLGSMRCSVTHAGIRIGALVGEVATPDSLGALIWCNAFNIAAVGLTAVVEPASTEGIEYVWIMTPTIRCLHLDPEARGNALAEALRRLDSRRRFAEHCLAMTPIVNVHERRTWTSGKFNTRRCPAGHYWAAPWGDQSIECPQHASTEVLVVPPTS